jgi:hypothetical protein
LTCGRPGRETRHALDGIEPHFGFCFAFLSTQQFAGQGSGVASE